MSPANIAAFISIFGILVSTATSWIISKYNAVEAIKKYKYEIQKGYADKLQEKRLDTYPLFHYYTSDFLKKMYKEVSLDYLSELYNKFIEIDSKYAVYLSGETSDMCYFFRRSIKAILDKFKSLTDNNRDAFWDSLNEMSECALKFEIGMKQDLGIFSVEFDPGKKFKSYDEIYSAYTKNKQ